MDNIKDNINIKRLIENKIKILAPKDEIIIPKHINLDEIQKIVKKASDIYEKKEIYDLKWALEDSQKNINKLFKNFLKKGAPFLKNLMGKNLILLNEIKDKSNIRRKNKLKRRIKAYSITSSLVSFIDIFISIILVLIITKIGHISESLFSSVVLSFLFFVFIILLKVTLDRYYIIPKVHKWGWNNFKKINIFFLDNITLTLAFLLVVDSFNNNENLDESELTDLFNKFRLMIK